MLPEHRLAVLLQQVKHSQIAGCLYHNTATSPSLYQDHNCDQSDFPLHSYVELTKHTGEVWQVSFSNDGKRLVSCGEDGTAVIYSTDTFEALQNLADHEKGITAAVWSPDDSLMVTCAQDRRARLWDTEVSSILLQMGPQTDGSSLLEVLRKGDPTLHMYQTRSTHSHVHIANFHILDWRSKEANSQVW